MSGSAAGGIAAVMMGAAVVAPVVVAAGVCYGIAKTSQLLIRTADDAWESHARIQEVRRFEAALAEDRHRVYREALEEFVRVRSLIAADKQRGGSLPVPAEPAMLGIDAELAELQAATTELTVQAASLLRERDSHAAVLLAQATAEALRHESADRATDLSDQLSQRRERLESQRREALADDELDTAAAATELLAEATAALLSAVDERSRSRIADLLASVPSELDRSDAAALETWSDRLAGLSGPELQEAEFALEGIVDRARARAEERRFRATVASAVVASLAGCDSPTARELVGRAKGYLEGALPWDPELTLKARAEQERVEGVARDLATAAVIAAALEGLGYEVGEDFVVDATRDAGFADMPAFPDHGVKVDLDAGRIALSVVRYGDASATVAEVREDELAERQLCAHLDELEVTARDAGLAIDLEFREDPGLAAVPVVGSGNRAAPLEREREMPL